MLAGINQTRRISREIISQVPRICKNQATRAAKMAAPMMNLSALEDDGDFGWSQDEDSSSEEEPPSVEQQFTVESKSKEPLIPVTLVQVNQPQQFIVKLRSVSIPGIELRSAFESVSCGCGDDGAARKAGQHLKKHTVSSSEALRPFEFLSYQIYLFLRRL